jgi:hypothetical protein
MKIGSLEPLLGKNAGAIAMTLNLPYVEPCRVVIDAAIAVQESLRSPWTFAGLDPFGNTLWMSPAQDRMLRVDSNGVITVERL